MGPKSPSDSPRRGATLDNGCETHEGVHNAHVDNEEEKP